MPSKRKRHDSWDGGQPAKKLFFDGQEVKLTKDGRPDMRFSLSKRYVASLQVPAGGQQQRGPLLRARAGNVVQVAASKAVFPTASNQSTSGAHEQPTNVRRSKRLQQQPILPLQPNQLAEVQLQRLHNMETYVVRNDQVVENEVIPAEVEQEQAAADRVPGVFDVNLPDDIPKTTTGLPDLRNQKAAQWVADIAVKIHRFSLDRKPPAWLPRTKDGSIDTTKKVAQVYVEAQAKAGGRLLVLPAEQQKLNKRSNYYIRKLRGNTNFLAAVIKVRNSVVKPESFILLNNEDILQTAAKIQANDPGHESSDEECFETPSYIPEADPDTLLITCPHTEQNRIGRGAFGAVYEGYYNGNHAAVKVLHLDRLSANDKEDFHKEVAILANFSNHRNLVNLFAFTTQKYYSIVMEYVELGSLQHLLYFANSDELEAKITDGRYKKKIIDGIANAMRELHAVGIIHNDLKPANVLITRDFTAKVCDFGLASLRGRTASLVRTDRIAGEDNVIAGTSAYMAPERLDGNVRLFNDDIRKAGDVYSFAITFNELLHEEEPFSAEYAHFAAMGVFGAARYAKNGRRPFLNTSKIPKTVQMIIQKCWHALPEDRPSFEAIVNYLKNPKLMFPNFIDVPQKFKAGT